MERSCFKTTSFKPHLVGVEVFVLVLVLVVAFVRRRRALRAARTTRPAAAHRSSRGVLVTWYCDQQQFFGFGVFVSCPEVL